MIHSEEIGSLHSHRPFFYFGERENVESAWASMRRLDENGQEMARIKRIVEITFLVVASAAILAQATVIFLGWRESLSLIHI